MTKYKGALKAALLDQTIMAGIGNIYADEICFLTKFHPETKCNTLTIRDVKNIVDAAEYVLEAAIHQGGTTIRSYTSSLGVTGRFQQSLLVHSKEKEPCAVCGTTIIKTRVAGRGTYYCPVCQTFKDDIKIIGLTGVIASGKTEITNYLSKQNIKVIDADEINRDILNPNNEYYLEILTKINKNFPIAVVNNLIDKRKLREIIFNNSEKRKALEHIVYPIIKKIIINEIKLEKFDIIDNTKPKLMFVSAPLLLESGFDALCTDLVILDVDKDIQIK
jgi:formamidopyrimidine-DNA glycosylase